MDYTALTNLVLTATSENQAKRIVSATGHVNPVGAANSKTGLPGTYRPVADTCPDCPLKGNGCYAQSGRVYLSQVRASALTDSSLRAATLGMVQAARYGLPARLHVSGDFLSVDGTVDVAYVDGLCAISEAIRAHYGDKRITAYTYTHIKGFEPFAARLEASGIRVRFSGSTGINGAFVVAPNTPKGYSTMARTMGATWCPNQAAKENGAATAPTCADCKLCWVRERPIMFSPDKGTGAKGEAI